MADDTGRPLEAAEQVERLLAARWKWVFRRVHKRMVEVARKAGVEGEPYAKMVEDAVREAFAEFWSGSAYAPRRGSVSVWLRMRARHFLRRDLRSAARWKRGHKAEAAHRRTREPGAELDSSEPERLATRDWVERGLSALRPDYAKALRLRYGADQTLKQVAEEMDCSTEALRSLLGRAKKALRAQLEGSPLRGPGRPPKTMTEGSQRR